MIGSKKNTDYNNAFQGYLHEILVCHYNLYGAVPSTGAPFPLPTKPLQLIA